MARTTKPLYQSEAIEDVTYPLLFDVYRKVKVGAVHEAHNGSHPIEVGMVMVAHEFINAFDSGKDYITDNVEFDYQGHHYTVNVHPTE